jgi:hypothetical protein
MPEAYRGSRDEARDVERTGTGETPFDDNRRKTNETWLSGLDSNQDKLLQRELCYHYTTGQHRRGRSDYAAWGTLAKKNLGGVEDDQGPILHRATEARTAEKTPPALLLPILFTSAALREDPPWSPASSPFPSTPPSLASFRSWPLTDRSSRAI